MKRVSVLIAATALLAGTARAAEPSADAQTARLRADLLSHASATEVLTRWCADRNLASPPVIHAIRDRSVEKTPDASVRALLLAGQNDEIRYRRVRLTCGEQTLSVADNWYLPSRLTPAMNRQLDETDTPFGAVVRPLAFTRQTLEAMLLPGIADILRVHAVLKMTSGVPFSVIVETYERDIIRDDR